MAVGNYGEMVSESHGDSKYSSKTPAAICRRGFDRSTDAMAAGQNGPAGTFV
jgi:hypothetical protein